jgi:hypothetical protein
MYLMVLAVLGTYLGLLCFLFYGRFSSALLKAKFKTCFSLFIGPVTDDSDKQDEGFSILHGRFRYSSSYISTKNISRPNRSSSIPRYHDHHHFTKLNKEKADLVLREEALAKDRTGQLRKPTASFLMNREHFQSGELEGAYWRHSNSSSLVKESLQANSLPIYSGNSKQILGTINWPDHYISGLSRDHMIASKLSTPKSKPTHSLRLSRGLWAKNRRRNLPSRIAREQLYIIPESRDESEEHMSTVISEAQHFSSSRGNLDQGAIQLVLADTSF